MIDLRFAATTSTAGDVDDNEEEGPDDCLYSALSCMERREGGNDGPGTPVAMAPAPVAAVTAGRPLVDCHSFLVGTSASLLQ